MKGCFVYRLNSRLNHRLNHRLNNDIKNIIEMMVYRCRMKHINDEYRRVFYFFNFELSKYDNECPNPHGRCVGKYINVTIHWLNGKYHKLAGPAIEYANDVKCWYYKGRMHRKDGPAVEYANGTKYWYVDGKLHREDCPAVEYVDGRPNEYWEFGYRIIK